MSTAERYFSLQPNVPGKGILAGYSREFWLVVVAIGVFTGLAGAGLMELLHLIERLLWSYSHGDFLNGVEHASALHRVLVLLAAGVIAGIGALLLRRLRGIGGGEVSEAVWLEEGRMSMLPSFARGLVSIVIVGMGASIGREAAPQLAGASFASCICERAGLSSAQRKLLVACGAGAGMAAVYNIPLGGALFASEVLLGTLSLPLVMPALATSTIATAVAWVALPVAPTYHVPVHNASATMIVWAILIGPVAGFAAAAWVRLVALAHNARPTARLGRVGAPVITLGLLGVLAIVYPQLLGNGKDTVQIAVSAGFGLGLFAVLMVLKPLVTAACLGSGAPGGLFTPTLTFGVLLGGLLGHLWTGLWPGASVGSYAIIGGAAVLAASMQGPLAAAVMMLELVHFSDTLMVPVLLAVIGSTIVVRRMGLPSIYSARLANGTPIAHPVVADER